MTRPNYAKIMRELRGDLTYHGYRELTGITHLSQRAWERGEIEPTPITIDRLAETFGWSDEYRMWLMPESKSADKLSRKLNRRIQWLSLTNIEAAKALGTHVPNISKWRHYSIPERSRTWVISFLEQSDEEIMNLVNKGVEKPKRSKIPYDLIYELEEEYGDLSEVPDDNEKLITIQIKLGAKQGEVM